MLQLAVSVDDGTYKSLATYVSITHKPHTGPHCWAPTSTLCGTSIYTYRRLQRLQGSLARRIPADRSDGQQHLHAEVQYIRRSGSAEDAKTSIYAHEYAPLFAGPTHTAGPHARTNGTRIPARMHVPSCDTHSGMHARRSAPIYMIYMYIQYTASVHCTYRSTCTHAVSLSTVSLSRK
jgi:hypothetical protein